MSTLKSGDRGGPKTRRFPRVVLLFVTLAVLLDVAVWYLGKREYLAFLDIFTSSVVTGLIHLSGLQAHQDSNTIYLAHSVWVVTIECTAIQIMTIYTAFVLAYPAAVRAKGLALLAGLPFIFGMNILRLWVMAWIDKLAPNFSTPFHNYVWQVAFIIMVILMWLVWLEKVVKRESKSAVSP